jgi:hypothetical protein
MRLSRLIVIADGSVILPMSEFVWLPVAFRRALTDRLTEPAKAGW